MWPTIALSLALNAGPAPASNLGFENVRATYSVLGPERKDVRFLPGDVYVLSFDIVGLKADKDGRVRYGMGIEVTRKGVKKPVCRVGPRPQEKLNTLGGTRLPSYAIVPLGTAALPGEYTLKVTVTDRNANPPATRTISRKFEVVPTRLGFVRVALSYDPERPAPALAVRGQTLYLNFFLVGFELDKVTKQPDLLIEMSVRDAAGKPTLPRPVRGEIKRLVDNRFQQLLPFEPLELQMNRAGKYRVILKATDNLARTTVGYTLDVVVVDNK